MTTTATYATRTDAAVEYGAAHGITMVGHNQYGTLTVTDANVARALGLRTAVRRGQRVILEPHTNRAMCGWYLLSGPMITAGCLRRTDDGAAWRVLTN